MESPRPCAGFPLFGKGKRKPSPGWLQNKRSCRSGRRTISVGNGCFADKALGSYPICSQCCLKAANYWDSLKPWFEELGELDQKFAEDLDSRWRKLQGLPEPPDERELRAARAEEDMREALRDKEEQEIEIKKLRLAQETADSDMAAALQDQQQILDEAIQKQEDADEALAVSQQEKEELENALQLSQQEKEELENALQLSQQDKEEAQNALALANQEVPVPFPEVPEVWPVSSGQCEMCHMDADIGCTNPRCRGVCSDCFACYVQFPDRLKLHPVSKNLFCLKCEEGEAHPALILPLLEENKQQLLKETYTHLVRSTKTLDLDNLIVEALVRRLPCCKRPFEMDPNGCCAMYCRSCTFKSVVDGREQNVSTPFCYFCEEVLPPMTTAWGEDFVHRHVKYCSLNPTQGSYSLSQEDLKKFEKKNAERIVCNLLNSQRSAMHLLPAQFDQLKEDMIKKYC